MLANFMALNSKKTGQDILMSEFELPRWATDASTSAVSLIDCILDTQVQGCTDLQSLITCLDNGDVAHYAVMQNCFRLRIAQCIKMHLRGYIYRCDKYNC